MYRMIRDPNYHLRKAEYFYQMAESTDFESDNFESEDYESDTEYDYVAVKKSPALEIRENKPSLTGLPSGSKNIIPTIPFACKRYFDPVRKHYYRTDKMFGFNCINQPRTNLSQKNPGTNFYQPSNIQQKNLHLTPLSRSARSSLPNNLIKVYRNN